VKVKPPIIKTKLITREGFNALKAEHDELWFKKRPEVTKIVSWAASLGDRSENADYTMNKRLLRQIDSRIRYLRKRLEDLKIVDYSPQQAGRVFFGAWVEIEDDAGQVLKFRIVGPDEIYGRTDYISIDAPMARALLKKQVDDSFVVQTPTGAKEWLVIDIQYPATGEQPPSPT
jgi:transcription elongation factor GreB